MRVLLAASALVLAIAGCGGTRTIVGTETRAVTVTVKAAPHGSSNAPLRRFDLPSHLGTIELPADWRFRDASYPSDHSTWFWYDPGDAFAKLEIVDSGCEGCVSKSVNGVTVANARAMVPGDAVVTAAPDPFTVAYRVFDAPYSDDGMVIVTRKGSKITGSVILDLWLPDRRAAEAAQILASLRLRQ
jgi:hypothetical protein